MRFERTEKSGSPGSIVGLRKCDWFGVLAGARLGQSFANNLAVPNDHCAHRGTWRYTAFCQFGQFERPVEWGKWASYDDTMPGYERLMWLSKSR
jgi:hypothetical protein